MGEHSLWVQGCENEPLLPPVGESYPVIQVLKCHTSYIYTFVFVVVVFVVLHFAVNVFNPRDSIYLYCIN